MNPFLRIFLFLLLSVNAFSQTKTIQIETKRNADKSVDFYYNKSEPGSFLLSIKFKKLDNASSRDYQDVVKGIGGKIFSLQPINKNYGIGYSYTYSYIRGVINPNVDSLYVYILPFEKGKSVSVIESNFLGSSYFGSDSPKNWKAYHFKGIDCDTAFATRKGLVVKVIDNFENDTLSYYTSKQNEIVVEHQDGTFARYTGFQKNGIFVENGQTVYPYTSLGILIKNTNSESELGFMVYFLTDSITEPDPKQTLNNQTSRNEFLTPLFYTSEGKQKLQNRSSYIVDFDDSTLFLEYTKRELKKMRK